MVQLVVVNEPVEIYLTPTDQRTNEQGVKVYRDRDGRWVDIRDTDRISPGMLVSVDGIVYRVSENRTEFTVTLYRKHNLPDGRYLLEFPGKRYMLVEKNTVSMISGGRFRDLSSKATSVEVELQISRKIIDRNREIRAKQSQPESRSEPQMNRDTPQNSQQPKPSDSQTGRGREQEQKPEPQQTPKPSPPPQTTGGQGRDQSNRIRREELLLFTTGARVISGLDFPDDRTAYGKRFRDWIDAANRVTGGKFLRELIRATGLSENNLRSLENLTLGEILEARNDLFRILSKRDITEEDIRALRSKYSDALLTLLLRTVTGDRELSVNSLNEIVRYLNSDEYRARRDEIGRISRTAGQLLDQKNVIERYYFMKHAWPAIQQMQGMRYVDRNNFDEFRLDSDLGRRTLETFLRERSANPYLLYKYGLPFLVNTTRSYDNLMAMLDVVEQVNRGIANASDGFGLNRLEQHRYYTMELPRIIASIYSNYAAALQSRVGSTIAGLENFQRNLMRYTSSPSGLSFDELRSVGELIDGFVRSGQEFRIPTDSFNTRGNTRASPLLTKPDIDLVKQGIIQNVSSLATRYNRGAGYYFNVSNEWLGIYGELFYESTERSGSGTGRVELRGTVSRVALEANGSTLRLIARDLEVLGNRTSASVAISPERVSGEIEAELDQVFGGANVGVVFERSGENFRGILYAKIDGNWYRIGIVDRSWLIGMDVVIPGLANGILDVKIGDNNRVAGVLGLSMPQLSIYTNLTNEDLNAIAAYLIDGNQLAVSSILTGEVRAPNLVYAGFYNGNAFVGGQYIGKDFAVSGMGVVGRGVGLELTFANRNIILSGSYANFGNLSSIAAAIRGEIGGYDGFAAFVASGERMFLGIGVSNNNMMLQAYRMSRVDPSIFGLYSEFFRDATTVTGVYAAFGGRGYGEVILAHLPQEVRVLIGGGVVLERDTEISGSIGIGSSPVYTLRAIFPVGVYMAALAYMYKSNKHIFTASLENRNWLFGFSYSNNMIGMKVRYGDQEGVIEAYGTVEEGRLGGAGSYGLYLNEGMFLQFTGATENLTAWYLGLVARTMGEGRSIEIELGAGGSGEARRIRLRVRALYEF
ncbi:MAG: hypothetical protein NZ908_00140 [Candidatus Micrarchaeota archaeon]|nr:hypothetical protein [Candidatus Micrarchaeota archaeon]